MIIKSYFTYILLSYLIRYKDIKYLINILFREIVSRIYYIMI